MTRRQEPGLRATTVCQNHIRELHLTLLPLPGEELGGMLQRLQSILREANAGIVKQDFFGPVALYAEGQAALKRLFGKIAWPVTWTDGAGCAGHQIGGLQVLAVAGAPIEPVHLEGRVVGTVYQDRYARHFLLGDLRPANISAKRGVQTSLTYEQLETALALKGMNMTNVIRTWFFLDDILSWYDDFNAVRNAFYTERKLIERLVPASTGVGIKNPHGSALVLGAWATAPVNGALTLGMLPSPLQCPAPKYGSCFSRAVEVATPGHRRVLVSGTASIKPNGASTHDGDMTRQVDLTMEVVDAILATRKLTFADVSRATAFIKRPQDAAAFAKWCKQRQPDFPATMVQADICRDELLFELELDAMAASPA